ncbi:MAG: PspC domain-containing protein [Candidatus Aminicenantes bacterium]|nr:PspC domain-containing protein [Candidatus Aminicenantes bacterium]
MKRLYRSRQNRMLGGVCGGIAEYFNIDPVIVRIIAVAFFFMGGSAFLAYILGLIIIPNEPFDLSTDEKQAYAPGTAPAPAPAQTARNSNDTLPLVLGIVLIFIGVIFLLHNIPFFNPFYWRAWHFARNFFWPSLLIAFGIYVIARGWKK